MKSEKEKLQAKSVEQLKASYKRMGGKLVNPDGKAKTKVQLINGIVMKNRLAGKSMGGNATTKKTNTAIPRKAKIPITEKQYANLIASVTELETRVKALVKKYSDKNKA